MHFFRFNTNIGNEQLQFMVGLRLITNLPLLIFQAFTVSDRKLCAMN